MLITKEDLTTELYPEVVAEITRSDDKEGESHIQSAIAFAKGFLFKYDLPALFGTAQALPTVSDEYLKKVIKIIAAYFLVRKANPSVSLKLFREDYILAVGTEEEKDWLFLIRDGKINPDWPTRKDDPNTPEDESKDNQDVF